MRRRFDLLVFDNGSGAEALDYLGSLYTTNRIQFLILSKRNLGKGRAWELIFNAAPGEVIAYADSDVIFYEGWLTGAIRLLETFPRVGMVSCRPMRTYAQGHTATTAWATQEPEARLEEGQFIEWEAFREHDLYLGLTEEEVASRFEQTSDLRVTYRTQQALIGAAHWQFVAYKQVLQACLPLGIERPLGDDRKLDEAINQAGYLRLMTVEPLVRHLGNTLPEGIAGPGQEGRSNRTRIHARSSRFLDFPIVRRLLLGIYNKIFRWYFYR